MISLQIQDNKHFMNTLLTSSAFNTFLLKEASLSTIVTYFIDGRSTEEDSSKYIPFDQIRPILFHLMKGKKTPDSMKLILHLKSSSIESILAKGAPDLPADTVKSFVVTIKYHKDVITLVSATAYQRFTLDKTADALWDQALIRFLEYHAIDFH